VPKVFAPAPYSVSFQPRSCESGAADAEPAVVATVALAGEIDIAVNDELQDAIDIVLADVPGSVVVDMSAVSFMDSTGLRFLVGFRTACDAADTLWTLRGVSPAVRRLIEISGLVEFLSPFD